MSYILLWIENLALALLLAATLFACISHIRRPWLRLTLASVTGILISLAYAGLFLLILHAHTKHKLCDNLLYPIFFLSLFVIAGIVVLRLRGFRYANHETKTPAAVNWPRPDANRCNADRSALLSCMPDRSSARTLSRCA